MTQHKLKNHNKKLPFGVSLPFQELRNYTDVDGPRWKMDELERDRQFQGVECRLREKVEKTQSAKQNTWEILCEIIRRVWYFRSKALKRCALLPMYRFAEIWNNRLIWWKTFERNFDLEFVTISLFNLFPDLILRDFKRNLKPFLKWLEALPRA